MSFKYLKESFIFAFFGLLFNSCEHLQITPKNYRGGNCDPDTVYFVNDVLPILNTKCAATGCHDSKTKEHDVVLDNYDNIIRTGGINKGNGLKSELIKVMRAKSEPMPPSGKLDDSYIAKVKKWIDQGALNNTCTPGCDSLTYSFTRAINSIIANNCLSCHQIAGNTVPLNSYSDIKQLADNGKLWGAIKHLPGYKAMPSDFTHLSDCDLVKIRKWIENGAKPD